MQKLYFAITITTLVALAGTAAVDPSIIRELAQEDHILENTTVAFLGASFALGVITARTRKSYPKPLSLILSTLSLIALLDEISFGQRLFNFQSIQIGNKYYFDGFHDIAEITKNAIYKSNESIIYGITIAALLAIFIFSIYASRIAEHIRFLAKEKLLWYFLIALCSAVIAQLVDIKILGSYISTPLEETLEAIAALGIFFCQLKIFRSAKSLD